MTELKNQFTDQEYTEYKRANYKHYDDRKIQELHINIKCWNSSLESSKNQLDYYVHRYIRNVLALLDEAEIPYENKYKHRKIESSQPIKKKRWWQRWK